MHSTKKDLLETLEKIQGIRALIVGDLILDRYVWGNVERVSPEAPVPIVDVRKTEDRLGGAANAALNITSVGAKANVCGFIGDDREGKIVLELLQSEGMGRDGVIVDRDKPTSLKTRVIGQKQQMLRIDRESRAPYGTAIREGFAAVVEASLESCDVVILSDYGKGCISESLIKRLKEARRQGKIDFGKRPLVVDPHPASYGIYDEICVAKPNRKEAEEAVGFRITDTATATKAARKLIDLWKAEMMLITLGEDGLIVLGKNDEEALKIETVALEVFDVSGAGDTVTAIFAAALATGATPAVAGDLANIAAGIVVSEVGTVPVNRQRLVADIERLGL